MAPLIEIPMVSYPTVKACDRLLPVSTLYCTVLVRRIDWQESSLCIRGMGKDKHSTIWI